jgi:hypothetical protein
MSGEEPVRGGQLVSVHLVVSRFNVDEDELALCLRAETRQNLAFIDLIATQGDLVSMICRYRSHETCSP